MACQPPSTLESLKEVQSHFRTKHSVSNLLTSRATKVVALPSSLSCHNLPCPLPHMCLLCEHKDGKSLSDGKLREHMAEMHGKFFSEEWEQFCTFHCRLCGDEVTCEERDHEASCVLEALRWWSSGDEEKVSSRTETCGLMCKKERRLSSKEAANIEEKEIMEEKPVYSALTGLSITAEVNEGIKETKNELELPLHNSESEELLLRQESREDAEQIKQEENISESDEGEGNVVEYVAMADCVQQDANTMAVSKSALAGPGVKKSVFKGILKSVIDINEDQCNRCPSDLGEGANMLLGIKTVKVKRVIRTTIKPSSSIDENKNQVQVSQESQEPTGGKTNDTGENAAKKVDGGNPKMSMIKIDSTSATLVVQWYEAAVIVGPEGKNVKELQQSTGARIMVGNGKAKHKGTRTITIRGDSSAVTRARNEIEKYRFSNCTAKVAISGLMARAIFSEAKTKFLNEVMMECKVLIGRDHYQYPKDGESIFLYLFGSEEAKREAKAKLEDFASSAMKVQFTRCQRFQLLDQDENGKRPLHTLQRKVRGAVMALDLNHVLTIFGSKKAREFALREAKKLLVSR